MRIIKEKSLAGWIQQYPDAASALERWAKVIRTNDFGNFAALRRVFASADQVTVRSGRTVVIFNIGGNKYRLVTAIHYNMNRVYAMLFLTHRQYDTDNWKARL